jgi:hypothetical protein
VDLQKEESANYPASVRVRLWCGACWAHIRRSAARRNLTTVTGFFLGGFSIVSSVIILLVPLYFEARNLPEQIAIYGVVAAYVYQFIFKLYRDTRVDRAALRHDLNRKLIERRIIKDIQEHLQRNEKLAIDRSLMETVLEAMVSKVAEKVGGYAEEHKLDANLMVQPAEKPGYLRVIARYGNTRDVPKDYLMEERFCSRVWRGDPPRPAVAGDILVIAPQRGKFVPYRDILSLPILDLSGRVVANVNIDSTEAHHFPKGEQAILELETEVAPYLALLRMIIAI